MIVEDYYDDEAFRELQHATVGKCYAVVLQKRFPHTIPKVSNDFLWTLYYKDDGLWHRVNNVIESSCHWLDDLADVFQRAVLQLESEGIVCR